MPLDVENQLESSKTHARRAAESLESATMSTAEHYRGKAERAWDDAKVQARTWREDGEEYVRDNPTRAVLSALGIGFVFGFIFRR
jgi:ElaB/YqjD/DUF883 family membrane-anchored ribosome-binding protein